MRLKRTYNVAAVAAADFTISVAAAAAAAAADYYFIVATGRVL